MRDARQDATEVPGRTMDLDTKKRGKNRKETRGVREEHSRDRRGLRDAPGKGHEQHIELLAG